MITTRYTLRGPTLKAAVVADLHNNPFSNIEESLEKEKPDVILIPGDLCNGHYVLKRRVEPDGAIHPFENPDAAISFLKKCHEIAPAFYSRGNHEWRMDDDDVAFIRSTGVVFLDDEFATLGNFVIGGLSSTCKSGKKYQGRLKPNDGWLADYARTPGYHILLSHHPENFDKYISKHSIELTISGHAHGGQWRIGKQGIYSPGQGFLPKLTRGMYRNNRLLVSAGLANTTRVVPRLFNPTELVYIEFEN